MKLVLILKSPLLFSCSKRKKGSYKFSIEKTSLKIWLIINTEVGIVGYHLITLIINDLYASSSGIETVGS